MKTTKVVACCTLTAIVSMGIGYLGGVVGWSEFRSIATVMGAVVLSLLFMWAIWVLAE